MSLAIAIPDDEYNDPDRWSNKSFIASLSFRGGEFELSNELTTTELPRSNELGHMLTGCYIGHRLPPDRYSLGEAKRVLAIRERKNEFINKLSGYLLEISDDIGNFPFRLDTSFNNEISEFFMERFYGNILFHTEELFTNKIRDLLIEIRLSLSHDSEATPESIFNGLIRRDEYKKEFVKLLYQIEDKNGDFPFSISHETTALMADFFVDSLSNSLTYYTHNNEFLDLIRKKAKQLSSDLTKIPEATPNSLYQKMVNEELRRYDSFKFK